jgi:carboxymethylenebutenolidase
MASDVTLTAADGHTFTAYRADPGDAPRGAIVVVQEIFGVNSHIRRVTDGFAADGYVAIAPAMFDRVERGVNLGYTQDAIAKGRALKAQITLDMMKLDLAATIASVAQVGKVGIVGYCWGGFVTWRAAAHVDGLSCAVPYYGGGILDHADDVPRVPVMGHFGERDAGIPADGVRKLAAKHPTHHFFLYEADHGFNCDERGSYDAASSQLARIRTLGFFRDHVG